MLLNIDLSGADFCTVAYLCRDQNMLDVVKSGRSPHPVTGSRTCGVTEAEVVADDKLIGLIRDPDEILARRKASMPEMVAKATFLPRTMSIRQMAKKQNHGLNFREGYKVFALMYEFEEREAKRIVEAYSSTVYPGIREWWERTDAQLTKTRTLTNCFGRKCYFMGQISNDMFKQGYAFIPASTTVDCCNAGMDAWMEDDSLDFRAARLNVQGHDSLLFSYPPTDFRAMARFSIKQGREYMRPVLDYGEPYQLNTDLKVGLSWGGLVEPMHKGDPLWWENEELLAERLREQWYVLRQQPKAA